MIKTETYILPQHWANWLINGDGDGLEPEDSHAMFDWAHKMIKRCGKCWCLGTTDDDPGFLRWHDAADEFPYASTCLEFVFDVTPETEEERRNLEWDRG